MRQRRQLSRCLGSLATAVASREVAGAIPVPGVDWSQLDWGLAGQPW